MSKLAQALKDLPETESRQVQPLFITVDAERDTPDAVSRFIHAFGTDFIGLTGSASQLEYVRNAFGAYASRQSGSTDSSQFDHSTSFFLIAPSRAFSRRISAEGSPADIARSLEGALRSRS
jgi:protein SCO1/2